MVSVVRDPPLRGRERSLSLDAQFGASSRLVFHVFDPHSLLSLFSSSVSLSVSLTLSLSLSLSDPIYTVNQLSGLFVGPSWCSH